MDQKEQAFPLVSEEYVVLHLHDGATVTGVLTTPLSPKAFALILQGSGNVGADGDVSSPFLGSGFLGGIAAPSTQIARNMAGQSIASFRYSKRGCENPEELKHQIFPYLIKDALSAFKLLKMKFPVLRAGIVGFSEGAIIALHLSREVEINFLFLLGLPTRHIDEILAYQFLDWPVQLIKRKLGTDDGSKILSRMLQPISNQNLPLVQEKWESLLTSEDGSISVEKAILPIYQKLLSSVRKMIAQEFGSWYASMTQLEDTKDILPNVEVEHVFLYHGADDAQIPADWILEDGQLFKASPMIRIFSGLGHCFSPMEGALRENKTSGPIQQVVLEQMRDDLLSVIKAT